MIEIPSLSGQGLSGGASRSGLFAAQAGRVSASHQHSANLTLYTAQGDKVTLSQGFSFQAEQTTYQALSRSPFATAWNREETAGFQTASEYSLSVEGHLNEEELADIQTAMEALDDIMRDFLQGDSEGSIQKTLDLVGLDSITSVHGRYQLEQQVTLEQITTGAVSGYGPALYGSLAPAQAGAETSPLTKLREEIRELMHGSDVAPGNLYTPVQGVFNGLLQDFTQGGVTASFELDLIRLIQEGVLEDLEELAGLEEEDEEAAEELAKLPEGVIA